MDFVLENIRSSIRQVYATGRDEFTVYEVMSKLQLQKWRMTTKELACLMKAHQQFLGIKLTGRQKTVPMDSVYLGSRRVALWTFRIARLEV